MSRLSTGLTAGSIRRRRRSYIAGFVAVLLGSAVLTSFAALLQIGLQPGVGSADRTTLIIMSGVVGGWSAVVVGAAVATTLAVTTRQRARELALLRSIGATPRQVVRMMIAETAVVATAAVLVAAPLGSLGSVVLLRELKSSGQVAESVSYQFGPLTYAAGAGAPLLAALLATWITARRAAARQVRDGLFDASTGGRTTSQLRRMLGAILVAGGFGNAIVTAIVCRGADPASSQSIASEGAIAGAIGFALLAPVLLETALPHLARLMSARGVAGQLAALNLQQRTQQAATPIMPVVILTGVATGTLSMQAVANAVSGAHRDRGTELLNYVIVGVITALTAAMLINLLLAVTADRRREYAQIRLAGATPDQVRAALRIETAVIVALGLAAGTVAAAFTAIPFSFAQGTGPVPMAAVEIHAAVVLGVTTLTFGVTLRAGRRAMSGNATLALAASA